MSFRPSFSKREGIPGNEKITDDLNEKINNMDDTLNYILKKKLASSPHDSILHHVMTNNSAGKALEFVFQQVRLDEYLTEKMMQILSDNLCPFYDIIMVSGNLLYGTEYKSYYDRNFAFDKETTYAELFRMVRSQQKDHVDDTGISGMVKRGIKSIWGKNKDADGIKVHKGSFDMPFESKWMKPLAKLINMNSTGLLRNILFRHVDNKHVVEWEEKMRAAFYMVGRFLHILYQSNNVDNVNYSATNAADTYANDVISNLGYLRFEDLFIFLKSIIDLMKATFIILKTNMDNRISKEYTMNPLDKLKDQLVNRFVDEWVIKKLILFIDRLFVETIDPCIDDFGIKIDIMADLRQYVNIVKQELNI